MSANAIDNSNLLNYRDDLGTTGFNPKVTYEYDAVAKSVEATDETTYPVGIYIKRVHVRVHDKFGGQVNGEIVEIPGSGMADEVTINVAALDASQGLDITATVIATDDRFVADGSAKNIQAAGQLGSWDRQKNA
jgi:hypothetical protein